MDNTGRVTELTKKLTFEERKALEKAKFLAEVRSNANNTYKTNNTASPVEEDLPVLDPPPAESSFVESPPKESAYSTDELQNQNQNQNQNQLKAFRKSSSSSDKATSSTIPAAYTDGRRSSRNETGRIIPRPLKRSFDNFDQNADMQSSSTFGGTATVTPSTVFNGPPAELPPWYASLRINPRHPSSDRGLEDYLRSLREDIEHCLKNRQDPEKFEHYLKQIRNRVNELEYKHVDEGILKRSKILETKFHGLPHLFLERVDGFSFPFDIRADAKALFLKWCRQDFNPDLMRGIKTERKISKKTGKARMVPSLDKNYPNRRSFKYFGTGDLVSGQWWPKILAALRDGAHGATEAGISGSKDEGAYSVLVSNDHYDDKDEGDTIYYCGTDGQDGKVTEDTKLLHSNIRNTNPVRVLRSAKLPDNNPLKPKFGYRYDGVYDVLSYEVLDQAKPANHRFLLTRQPGQDPIRANGLGAKPTTKDCLEYQTHKMLSTGS